MNGCSYVPIKLYLQNQVVGHSLQLPALEQTLQYTYLMRIYFVAGTPHILSPFNKRYLLCTYQEPGTALGLGLPSERDSLQPKQVRCGEGRCYPRPEAQLQAEPEQGGGEICPICDLQPSHTPLIS